MARSNNRFTAGLTYAACAPPGLCPPEEQSSGWVTARQRKCQPIRETGETAAGTTGQTEKALDCMPPGAGSVTEPTGLRAYGCVYHSGSQRLIVSLPGERAAVRFHNHSCLKRADHAEDDAGITIREAGDYEITFELHIAVKAAAPVAFEVLAGEVALPGGTFMAVLPDCALQCRGCTMATLQADDRIGVAMSSASVCEATLVPGGVAAMLTVKKLD